jgi:two-component system cell cycle response regulator
LTGPQAAQGGATRILVVDDVPDNVEILEARLASRGYEVVTAASGPEALRRVKELPPHLILLDVMMPEMDGHQVARHIKDDDGLPFIPIILVTALNEAEDVVQGLESGADDYIAKPYNFRELEARVRAMLRIKFLQDELDQKNRELELANRRLKKLSITDGLTELFNHRHVHELLHDEFERSARTGESIAVVMMDLDRFKAVNDTYGHLIGDAVLVEAAQRLVTHTREVDTVARYGGEEFILLLPQTDLEGAQKVAEKVRAELALAPVDTEAGPLRITLSAGVASHPRHGTSVESLLRAADRALYAAKAAGKNRVVTADAQTGAAPS